MRTYRILCVAAVSSCAAFAHGQLPSQQFGIEPGGTYEVYHNDTVNMENGNDFVRIPLFSLPQLGKLSLNFSAVSNTATWESDTWCSPDGLSCDYSATVINPVYGVVDQNSNYGSLGPTIVPDNFPVIQSTPYQSPDPNCTGHGSQPSYCYSTIYTVHDGTGAAHPLYYDYNNISQLRTTDGSGFLYLSGNVRSIAPDLWSGRPRNYSGQPWGGNNVAYTHLFELVRAKRS